MALTPTTADAVLKEDYQPVVREQLNQGIAFLQQIEKNDKDFEGRRAVIALHVSRNSGVGARAAGGTLPTAGEQGYAEQRVPVYRNYGRGQIDGGVIKQLRSDKGSFVRAVESETRGIVTDLKRDYSRQLFGTSDGVIASTGLTSNSTLVNLAGTVSTTQLRQIDTNALIDIGTVASPTAIATATKVSAVDTANKTITVAAAVSTTAAHKIFRTGSGGSGASQKEITGLQTIVSDAGSLHNIDPATYSVWKSTVAANGGINRSLTETLMATVVQDVEIASGEAPSLAVTSPGVFRAFANLQTSLKRFNDTVDLKGGYKGLTFAAGGAPINIVWDRDAPANRIFFFNPKHITHFVMSDWEFMEEDGAVLNRVSNQDAYEFTLFKYAELTSDQRNSHGLLSDITEA